MVNRVVTRFRRCPDGHRPAAGSALGSRSRRRRDLLWAKFEQNQRAETPPARRGRGSRRPV